MEASGGGCWGLPGVTDPDYREFARVTFGKALLEAEREPGGESSTSGRRRSCLTGCFVGAVTGTVAFFFGALNWYYKYEQRAAKSVDRH